MKATASCSYWICFTAGLLILFHAGIASSQDSWERWQEKAGPIPVVNQSPINLLFLQPVPDTAETLPKGRCLVRFNTTVTNTLVAKKSAQYAATVDTEMIRTSLDLSYGISPYLELGLSIPAAHYYSGFMDRPILQVEDTFGKPRYIRDREDHNGFTFSVKKDGKEFISASENSTGMGDLALRAKAKLCNENGMLPASSIRVAVKLPCGDQDRGFGSGEPDWGFGLLLDRTINRMSLYLNADVIFPGEAFDDAGISLREFYTAMIGLEYPLMPGMSAIGQLSWTARPFEDTGLDMLDKRIYDLLIGLTYRIQKKIYLQAGGVEDIFDSQDASADFTFFFNLGFTL